MAKHDLAYSLLSDSNLEAAKAFGLAFALDDETLAQYQEYGIDLEEASGQRHHMLPVPAAYVFTRDGVAAFRYFNPDYKVRVEPQELLSAARSALK